MPFLIPILTAGAGYFIGGAQIFKKDGDYKVTVNTPGQDVTVNPVVLAAAGIAVVYFLTKKK